MCVLYEGSRWELIALYKSNPFKILESKYIPHLSSQVVYARHKNTNADLVFIPCQENQENYFGACFDTPCFNDKGIPHILEHILLNGSVKFPISNAFLEVLKRSMSTMFGGATWGDRTVYPCGSMSNEDYLNLVDFLLDAVFNPLLEEVSFLQEGYRLDFENRADMNSGLINSGIVYNEMKGRENAPGSNIFIANYKSIFPEGSCAKFAGGLVDHISNVTHQEIKDYHKRYYIPSNCLLYVYTSIPFNEITTFLDNRLPKEIYQLFQAEKLLQPIFKKPVRIEVPINSSKESECTVKSSWLVSNAGNPFENFSLNVLSDILLSHTVSPLKKVLMDSRLGNSISPWIFLDDDIQNVFSIGLGGVKREQADEVFQLIQDGLRACANTSFEPGFVSDVLVSKELQLRKRESYWLFMLLDTVCKAWVHGEDIITCLDIDYKFKRIREEIDGDSNYFQKLIKTKLLSNPHRVDGVFYPNKMFFDRKRLKTENELHLINEGMTVEDKNILMNQIEQLENYSNPTSNEEIMKYVPHLSLEHLPKIRTSMFSKELFGSDTALITNVSSPDLSYLDMCFDMSALPEHLVKYLSFFSKFITKAETEHKTYLEMNEFELSCSGGIQANLFSIESNPLKTGEYKLIFQIGSFCLPHQFSDMLLLLRERIFQSKFDCKERVLSVSEEIVEQNRSRLNQDAKKLCILMSQAGLTASKYYENLINGIPGFEQIATINKESADLEIKMMKEIHDYLISNATRTLVWTGPEEKVEQLRNWSVSLPKTTNEIIACNIPNISEVQQISRATNDVESSFASSSLKSVPPVHPLSASGAVMMKLLFDFINSEIVGKNSAYYVESFLKDGLLTFASIRDPFPEKSIAVFRAAAQNSIDKIDFSRRSIDDAIIFVLKELYKPVYPSDANHKAATLYFANKNPEFFDKYLESLLLVNEDSIREFAELQRNSISSLHSCIISSAKQ